MYFTSGSDRAFEQLMQGKPGFDHYDSGEAVTPEDCGTCRFYRPHWKYQFCVYAECPYQPGKLTAYDAVTFRVKGVENMAVFRVERNKGYTVMSNHHLRNKDLSLKAKGLLSQMLSLPEDWDYTLKGLSLINREQIDAIRAAIRELEQAGYIVRSRERDSQGRLRGADYVIYEQPQPVPDSPTLENPMLDNPTQEKPTLGKPTQLNKDISSKEKSITDVSITDPIPILSRPSPLEDEAAQPPERKGTEAKSQSAIEIYRQIIMDNIEYEHLCQHVKGIDRETLDEIVDLLVETVCSARKTIRIAGDDYPAELVKSKFIKLDSSHIEFVFDCLSKNTSEMLMLIMGGLQSCTAMFGSAGTGVAATSYLSEDSDMLGAEAAYADMEADLQYELDNYESLHPGYDEYRFDLDEIGHDPYVLTSILSALHEGVYTLGDVQGNLAMLFEKQYTLTQTIETETRYRTETRTDSEGNTYTVQVPYTYYICNVKLENFDMSHLPVYIMGEEQMSLYAVYMHTLGNRPDLFPNGTYPNASTVKEPTYYDIPPEALEDATFAAMMAEAEKYVGYPYVWGGSSPSTSFDCSGFVSWVINHSGWDVGRLGAQGLCNICTPVSPEQAKPGDLVFFVGTYDTPGVSHVGIYVGNSVMLHCGDPISYTNLNSSYWQQHFYCYGRLP